MLWLPGFLLSAYLFSFNEQRPTPAPTLPLALYFTVILDIDIFSDEVIDQ